MNMSDKKNLIKYIGFILFLVVLAAFLSHEKKVYTPTTYFLESKLPKNTKKPDFSAISDTNAKKQAFIEYVLEGVKIANTEICSQEKKIQNLKNTYDKKHSLNKKQEQTLETYLQYYKIDPSNDINTDFDFLRIKIGKAPTSFILAQAILESGWGTSRFSKQYNNYFGLHCFRVGCGVKAKASDVYLETFKNISQSVLGYYYRLNTGSKFKDFRITRDEILTKKLPEHGLLDTLENYSELGGDEYKNRLISVIEHNNLTKYDSIKYC